MSWRRIAEVVAKEATYRSRKEAGRNLRFFRMTGGSMLKYNAFLLAVFTFMSLGVGLSAFGGPEVAYPSLITLFVMEILMGVLFMALNLQVLVSDKLLEPIFHLPVGESEIRKALLWVGIYWGGAALPFVLIPGGVVASYLLGDPLIAVGAAIGSLVALILSMALGYLAGSLATKYTRSIKGRAISTLIWLLVLGVGFVMGPLMDAVSQLYEGGALQALYMVPPISFVMMFRSPEALSSSLILILASYILFRIGTSRFWRVATRGEVPLPKGPAKWSLSFGFSAALMREVKVATRTPRILASLLMYSFIFPITFVFPLLSEGLPQEFAGFLAPIALAVGGLGGFSILYLYVMEAAGAKTLYSLPLTRGRIAMVKFYTFMTVNMPVAALIAVALAILIPNGAVPALIYLAALSGSALLNSLIYALLLPEEPSHWSAETFGRTLVAVLFLIEGIAYFAVGIASLFLPYGFRAIITLAGLAAIWIADLILLTVGGRRAL